MAGMTREELFRFVDQIYRRAGENYAHIVLQELEAILTEEGVSRDVMNTLAEFKDMHPELKDAYKDIDWYLSADKLSTLKQKQQQRKRWEEENARHGRC